MIDINKQQQLSAELANKLWACANDLRGNMDASEFKNYILGLIFYRFLSQKVETHFEEELKEDVDCIDIPTSVGFTYGTTAENLKAAAEGENEEATSMYPEFADVADEEGFPAIAIMYRNIAIAEKGHEERYLAFLANIENESVFKKEETTVWQCRNCGFVHEGTEAPKACPACLHPQAYFEVKKTNY